VKQADAAIIRGGAKASLRMNISTGSVIGYFGDDPYNNGHNNVVTASNFSIGEGGSSTVTTDISINTPGVEETRPANVAVRYLIKALP
jgi:hypothetical protein